MIEDRIQILRRAAKVSSRENNEHVWCVIAGNEKLVDDIAYSAITAKDRVQILFRESIKILDKYTSKRFDCLMLKGETLKISELRNRCNEKGGASVEITNVHINEMPNLLVIVGPEESMKSFNGETNRQNTKINILAEDHTSSFIKAELNTRFKLLSAILVSVVDEDDIEHVKEISQSNSLFGIDLKKTIQDKEKQRIFEDVTKNQTEPQEENNLEDNKPEENTTQDNTTKPQEENNLKENKPEKIN